MNKGQNQLSRFAVTLKDEDECTYFSCRCGTIPSHSRHDPPNDPYFGINLGIDSPTQETIRIGDPVQVIRMQRSNLPLSQKVILAAISVSTLVSIVAVVLRKYR